MKPICNRDCFNCIYEDCIDDSMDSDDLRQSNELDREFSRRTAKQERERVYYRKNREKIRAYQKEYYKRKKKEAQRVNQGQDSGTL